MSENVIETFLKHKVEHQALDTFKPTILTDSSKQVIDLEKYEERPKVIRHQRTFDDLRGFVDYVNDYKTDTTVCFAGNGKLEAFIDFHGKDDPRWLHHAVDYHIERSNRWKIWENAHNKWMNQKEFSDFLDTGLNEIVEPKQTDILNLVKNFRATVNFDVDYEDTNGGTNFTYRKQVKSGSTKKETIEVPEYIMVALQPFNNLNVLNPRIKDEAKRIPAYQLRAKINWRTEVNHADEQAVQFKVQILNFESAIDETLEAIRVAIKELTGVKTYIG